MHPKPFVGVKNRKAKAIVEQRNRTGTEKKEPI